MFRVVVILVFTLCTCLSPSLATAKASAKKKKKGKIASVEAKLTIQSPSNTVALYDSPAFVSSFYDTNTDEMLLSGEIIGAPRAWGNNPDFQVIINGDVLRPATKAINRRYRRGKKLLADIGFSKRLPVREFDPWPMRPFYAELVEISTDEVKARDKIAIYDLRKSAEATPLGETGGKKKGFYTQLTDPGLGYLGMNDQLTGLESPHRSSLPHPDLATFNADLTERALTIPNYDDDSNELDACTDLATLSESRFRDILEFPPYAEAFAEAVVLKEGYDQAQTDCLALIDLFAIGVCLAGLETTCVKNDPDVNDFVLCVDQIEGETTSLTINRVDDVGLNFLLASDGSKALLNAHTTIDGFHGKVRGHLRSLSVRWKATPCVGRPRGNLNDNQIAEKPWLQEWTTCNNMELDSGSASTEPGAKPGQYSVASSNVQATRLGATLEEAGDFTFADNTRNAEKGSCALDFIDDDADAMLLTFRQPLRTKLNGAWFGTRNSSQQADALTKLFSPYNLSSINLAAYELTAALDLIYSDSRQGMNTSWQTTTNPTQQVYSVRGDFRYFYYPETDAYFSVDALDSRGDPFDISFGITTSFLNRVLDIKSSNRSLTFTFDPTWDELAPFGVVTPAGAAATDAATLNADTLTEFDSAFDKALKRNQEAEILIRATFDPFIFMPPDPGAQYFIPNVGSPTTYGIEGLEVIFKAKDVRRAGKVVQGKEFVRAHVGFTDIDFRLNINNVVGSTFLVPDMNSDEWHAKVITSNLPSCEMFLDSAPPAGTCEDLLEENIKILIETRLRQTFLDYLTQVITPQFFDADGEASIPVYWDNQSRLHDRQVITFFGQLVP